MSYTQALEAAGAEVLSFEQFGSYQGEWWARVNYNGQTGYINGSYGSCSGCDAFEAEFGFKEGTCDDHSYNFNQDCEHCQSAKKEYEFRLADFGRTYLDTIYTYEEALAQAKQNLEWDSGAQEMVEWLHSHRLIEFCQPSEFKH
mgnify:CR=1 FL=1